MQSLARNEDDVCCWSTDKSRAFPVPEDSSEAYLGFVCLQSSAARRCGADRWLLCHGCSPELSPFRAFLPGRCLFLKASSLGLWLRASHTSPVDISSPCPGSCLKCGWTAQLPACWWMQPRKARFCCHPPWWTQESTSCMLPFGLPLPPLVHLLLQNQPVHFTWASPDEWLAFATATRTSFSSLQRYCSAGAELLVPSSIPPTLVSRRYPTFCKYCLASATEHALGMF